MNNMSFKNVKHSTVDRSFKKKLANPATPKLFICDKLLQKTDINYTESPKSDQPFLWIAEEDRGLYETSDWDIAILVQQKMISKNEDRKMIAEDGKKGDVEEDMLENKREKKGGLEVNHSEEKKEQGSDEEEDDDNDAFGGNHRCVKCCGKEVKKVIHVQPVTSDKAEEVIAKFTKMHFGMQPEQMTCPVCMRDVKTVTDGAGGTLSCIACTVIFFLGGCFGCCLIPFCVPRCLDIQHTCPHCDSFLGLYSRI